MSNSQVSQPKVSRLDKIRLHQSILLKFSQVCGRVRSIDRLLDHAAEQIVRATDVHHSKVLRYSPEVAGLKVLAGRGWRPGVVGHAVLATDMDTAPGRCFQTKTVVFINDISASSEFRPNRLLQEHGIQSLINAPVSLDGIVWGVIEADSTRTNAFDGDDEIFIQSLGLVMALAIKLLNVETEKNEQQQFANTKINSLSILMAEHNHRVRNYFQMILSLLSLRSGKTASEEMRIEYRGVMDRVAAISLAHDLLKTDSTGGVIEVATYLGALCDNFERTLGQGPKIARSLEQATLRSDSVAPLGLIANELLTNCIKYARIERPDRHIAVKFSIDHGSREGSLTVEDNGPGMGEQRAGSQGLRFVRALSDQISGRLAIDSAATGTRISVIFPVLE